MGLRETPLQNGVILRSLLFAELSSDIGEPSICGAKTFTSGVEGLTHPGGTIIPRML